MPFVQLRRNWPTETFLRTVHCGATPEQLEFTKDPTEVTDVQWEELTRTSATALEEVEVLRVEQRQVKREQAAATVPQPVDTPVKQPPTAAKKPGPKKATPKKPARGAGPKKSTKATPKKPA